MGNQNIVEYVLLEEETPENLTEKITEALNEDWILYGNHTVTNTVQSDPMGGSHLGFWYQQAMVKYEGAEQW